MAGSSPAMTPGRDVPTQLSVLATQPRPSLCMGPRKQRAQETPGAGLHPQPRVRKGSEAHEQSHHRSCRSAGVSRANGFNGLFHVLPGDRLYCLRHQREKSSLGLTPASGRQDRMASPYATSTVRLSVRSRPSHPALNVRDDRDTPLLVEAG